MSLSKTIKRNHNFLRTLAEVAFKGSYNTILVLAILWRLANQMALSESFSFYNRWRYGELILNMWCDLIKVESPIGLFSLQSFLIFLLLVSGEAILVGLLGQHLVLDYVLNGLLLARLSMSNYINQLSEKCNDLCERFFDMFESIKTL